MHTQVPSLLPPPLLHLLLPLHLHLLQPLGGAEQGGGVPGVRVEAALQSPPLLWVRPSNCLSLSPHSSQHKSGGGSFFLAQTGMLSWKICNCLHILQQIRTTCQYTICPQIFCWSNILIPTGSFNFAHEDQSLHNPAFAFLCTVSFCWGKTCIEFEWVLFSCIYNFLRVVDLFFSNGALWHQELLLELIILSQLYFGFCSNQTSKLDANHLLHDHHNYHEIIGQKKDNK